MSNRIIAVPLSENFRNRNISILYIREPSDYSYFTPAPSVNRKPGFRCLVWQNHDFDNSQFGKGIRNQFDAVSSCLVKTTSKQGVFLIVRTPSDKIQRITTFEIDKSIGGTPKLLLIFHKTMLFLFLLPQN